MSKLFDNTKLILYIIENWVIGAAVAQCLYTAKVRGSNPLSPTNLKNFMSDANPKIIDLSNKSFKEVDGLFLLDFWAPWCGPCVKMEPTLLKLVSEETDPKLSDLRIGKINVDQDSDRSAEFGVRSIPSMFLVKISGGEIEKLVNFTGVTSYENLKDGILKHL